MRASERPPGATPQDWKRGERCIAYHPTVHPGLTTATVVRDFVEGPRAAFVKVAFHDDGETTLTHKQNVYALDAAAELGVDVSSANGADFVTRPSPGAIAGGLIKTARESAQLTIREVARRSGISPSMLSRIEAGTIERPSDSSLTALARALGRHPTPLLMACHPDPEHGRTELLGLLKAADTPSAGWDTGPIAEHIRVLSATDKLAFAELAAEIFPLLSSDIAANDETLDREGSPELRRLVDIWNELPLTRRERLVDYATDQQLLARFEREQPH